jgi:hypothetical protein
MMESREVKHHAERRYLGEEELDELFDEGVIAKDQIEDLGSPPLLSFAFLVG